MNHSPASLRELKKIVEEALKIAVGDKIYALP
jgi:hypothetical protein